MRVLQSSLVNLTGYGLGFIYLDKKVFEINQKYAIVLHIKGATDRRLAPTILQSKKTACLSGLFQRPFLMLTFLNPCEY